MLRKSLPGSRCSPGNDTILTDSAKGHGVRIRRREGPRRRGKITPAGKQRTYCNVTARELAKAGVQPQPGNMVAASASVNLRPGTLDYHPDPALALREPGRPASTLGSSQRLAPAAPSSAQIRARSAQFAAAFGPLATPNSTSNRNSPQLTAPSFSQGLAPAIHDLQLWHSVLLRRAIAGASHPVKGYPRCCHLCGRRSSACTNSLFAKLARARPTHTRTSSCAASP